MKKLLIMTLALGMLAGCKKGPNDPGISFRSRDARIVGEWLMESMEEVNSTRSGSTSQESTSKYNGGKITTTTKTNGAAGTPVESSSSYKGTLTLEKDGTAKFVQVATPSTGTATTTTQTGTWRWLNGKKNKSAIMLTDFSTSLLDEGIYTLDELRNKKFVIKSSTSSETQSTSTNSSSKTKTMTFTQ